MKVLNRIYLVLALVLGVLGIIQCTRLRDLSPLGYLIMFLPSAMFGFSYLISRKPQRFDVHAILVIVSLLASGFVVLMCWSLEFLESGSTEITDVHRYTQILDDYSKSHPDLVSHFPKSIPADARNIHFSYLPHCLQQGAHVQLRYTLTQAGISELNEYFATKKTLSVRGGDAEVRVGEAGVHKNTPNMPTTEFYTSEARIDELGKGLKSPSYESLIFPEDYEIMVLDPLVNNVDWNHGQSHGVAISKKRSEIVYWMEAW